MKIQLQVFGSTLQHNGNTWTGIHDNTWTGPHDNTWTGPHDNTWTGPHDNTWTGPHDNTWTGQHDNTWTGPHDNTWTGPHDNTRFTIHVHGSVRNIYADPVDYDQLFFCWVCNFFELVVCVTACFTQIYILEI